MVWPETSKIRKVWIWLYIWHISNICLVYECVSLDGLILPYGNEPSPTLKWGSSVYESRDRNWKRELELPSVISIIFVHTRRLMHAPLRLCARFRMSNRRFRHFIFNFDSLNFSMFVLSQRGFPFSTLRAGCEIATYLRATSTRIFFSPQ